MPVLLWFTKYGRLGASSRIRSFQYIEGLLDSNFEILVQELFDDSALTRKYKVKRYSPLKVFFCYLRRFWFLLTNRGACLFIEKELFPYLPYWIESLLIGRRHYILDYDDAVFANYENSRFYLIRFLLGGKHKKLMSRANSVIAGNRYLGDYAKKAGSEEVILIPSSVDVQRYVPKVNYFPQKPVVVWIGSPSTFKYIESLFPVLEEVSKVIKFKLRIIGVSQPPLFSFKIPYVE